VLMTDATIGWGWPSRDAIALDDERLAGCYATSRLRNAGSGS
jgi:hypothetical protein